MCCLVKLSEQNKTNAEGYQFEIYNQVVTVSVSQVSQTFTLLNAKRRGSRAV